MRNTLAFCSALHPCYCKLEREGGYVGLLSGLDPIFGIELVNVVLESQINVQILYSVCIYTVQDVFLAVLCKLEGCGAVVESCVGDDLRRKTLKVNYA